MSSKVSIKYEERTPDAPGYYLYEDAMDDFGGTGENAPVYLELDGVQVELVTTDQGARVTVVLPKDTARALGILPAGA